MRVHLVDVVVVVRRQTVFNAVVWMRRFKSIAVAANRLAGVLEIRRHAARQDGQVGCDRR